MRIACYGWVAAGAASLAGAHSLVLRELLDRGHVIHLYGNPSHVQYPDELAVDNFSYVPVESPLAFDLLPPEAQRIVNYALSPVVRAVWRRRYEPEARCRHKSDHYDVLLTLGTPPVFAIEGVPTFVWLQGPPDTERQAIDELRVMIIETSGQIPYRLMSAYYQSRRVLDPFHGERWDGVGCGSSWAADALARNGVARNRTYSIPYPVDLDVFTPSNRDPDCASGPLILFVGRLDPRKRIDLLLKAFKELYNRIPDCRLVIVGSLRYAKGQQRLIEEAAQSYDVTHVDRLPRSDIPDLMRAAAVLVQPSMNENFGSAVAEALACGTPVVVGSTNGTRDYISSESVVLDRYSPNALADAMECVIGRVRSSPSAVRASARLSAEKYFGVQYVASLLESALEETIARHSHP